MNAKIFISLVACANLAVITICADKFHWLGSGNLLLLSLLGILHLIISFGVLCWIPSGISFRIFIIGFLVVGQLWGIELITMITIWKIFGFNR